MRPLGKDAAHDSTRDAEACVVLAMAQHQLKQTNEARATLAEGFDIVKTKMPKLDSGELGGGWVDRIIAHALVTEAKALLQGQTNTATEKKSESR